MVPNPAVSSLNIFDIYFFLVAEGILPLCGLYITEGILSVREDATTFWVTAEGIQPLSGLQQEGYGHAMGYSRWDIVTLWVKQRGYIYIYISLSLYI